MRSSVHLEMAWGTIPSCRLFDLMVNTRFRRVGVSRRESSPRFLRCRARLFRRWEPISASRIRFDWGEGTTRGFSSLTVGAALRDNREPQPQGEGLAPGAPTISALGPYAGIELRKHIDAKRAVGAKLAYFAPLAVGAPGFNGPPSAGEANWSGELYALFWLSSHWGLTFDVSRQLNAISYRQGDTNALHQIQMNEWTFGASLVFGWGG